VCWFRWHCSPAPLLSGGIVGYVGSTNQATEEFHLVDVSMWHVICSFRNPRDVYINASTVLTTGNSHHVNSSRSNWVQNFCTVF
jgi:hypothetical protein